MQMDDASLDTTKEHSFFEYIFFASASALPRALWNALLISPFSVVATVLNMRYGRSAVAGAAVLTPFSVLVGLMLSSRINESYGKYRAAHSLFNRLGARVSQCFQRLMAYTPKARRNEAAVVALRERLRRHLVLASCLAMQSLRDQRDVEKLRAVPGLMSAEEAAAFITAPRSAPGTEGAPRRAAPRRPAPQHGFPHRNRPALVFLWLHETVAELAALLHIAPPLHAGLDGLISSISELFQEAEALARVAMPAPYAQINRLTVLAYLLLLPFALAAELGALLVPAMFVANVIYFGLERCANMMDNPFGQDAIDLDLDKVLRRIDRLSSALIGASTGLDDGPELELLPLLLPQHSAADVWAQQMAPTTSPSMGHLAAPPSPRQKPNLAPPSMGYIQRKVGAAKK